VENHVRLFRAGAGHLDVEYAIAKMNFVFPHRIARLSYLLRTLALSAMATPMARRFDEGYTQAQGAGPLVILGVGVVAILIYWVAAVVVPRCRDLGMAWWISLVAFVPLLNLLFAVCLVWAKSRVSGADALAVKAER
jgi:uncharacterized membrane protein YhaH (DUF805 family)